LTDAQKGQVCLRTAAQLLFHLNCNIAAAELFHYAPEKALIGAKALQDLARKGCPASLNLEWSETPVTSHPFN